MVEARLDEHRLGEGETTNVPRVGLERFVRAMLKEGSARVDPAEDKTARRSLFDEIVGALGPKEEILIVRPGDSRSSDIVVKIGHEDEAPLAQWLGHGSDGARWANGIADLMQSKGIFALHLGQDITRRGFDQLLETLTQPCQTDDPIHEGRSVDRKVRALNLGATGIVAEASLPDPTRRLNWIVNLALARMRSALHDISLSGRSGQMTKMRTREMASLATAVENVRSPASLKEVLLHLDVLDTEAVRLPELDLFSETVRMLPREELAPLVSLLLEELDRAREVGAEDSDDFLSRKRIVRAITPLLLEGAAGQDLGPLLQRLASCGFVADAKLPDPKRRLKTKLEAEGLSDGGEALLQALESARGAEQYAEKADRLTEILPNLARAGKLEELRRILSLLDRHRRAEDPGFRERGRVAGSLIQKAIGLGLVRMLGSSLRDGPEGSHETLVEMFLILKEGAVSDLIEILKKSDDRSVRRTVVEALAGMGDAARRETIEELEAADQPWFVTRNLLLVMEKVGTAAESDLIGRFLDHPHPRVREEALESLACLEGSAAEPHFLQGLLDVDTSVKRRALECLTEIRSESPTALDFVTRLLGERDRDATTAPITLRIEACRFLALVGNVVVDRSARMRAEDLLLTLLRERASRDGLSTRFRRAANCLRRGAKSSWQSGGQRVRAAAYEALGAIGDETALDEIARLLRLETDPVLQRIAQAADQRIKERTSHETVPEQDPLHRS